LAGATLAAFDLSEAQRLFGLEGELSTIEVIADDGVSSERACRSDLGLASTGAEVVTGARVQEDIDTFAGDLGFLTIACSLAGVAVFVGAFIIKRSGSS
jgi:hypothetical protein